MIGPPRGRAPLAAVVALAAVLPFLGSLRAGFVFDDRFAILHNPVVAQPLRPATLLTTGFWGEAGPHSIGSYRPLTVLSFALDHRLGGGRPWAFHLTNLWLHGLAAMVLFLVLDDRLGRRGLAALAATLFGVHALHTENVAGIVGRADALAAVLGLTAWALARRRRPALAALAGPCLLAALLAKETAIAFVGIALAEDALRLDPERPAARRTRLLALAAMALAVVAYAALRAHALGRFALPVGMQSNPLAESGVWERLLTSAGLLARAVSLLLLPLVMSADYSFAEILPAASPWHAEVLVGLLCWVGLGLAVVALRRRRPVAVLGAVIFLAAYVPVANLLVLIPTIFAERLLYLPSIGLCVALAAGAFALGERRPRVAIALAALVLLGHAGRAALRTEDWRSDRTLFGAAVAATPRSARAWQNLGVADLEDRAWEAAAARFRRAIAIAPRWGTPHSYLGVALDRAGDPAGGLEELRRATALFPDSRECTQNLVSFHLEHRLFDDASAAVSRFRAAGGPAWFARQLEARIALARVRAESGATRAPAPR